MNDQNEEIRQADDATILTVAEACRALRVSKWTLYELIRSRRLDTIRIGRRRLVPRTSVRALVAQLQAEEVF